MGNGVSIDAVLEDLIAKRPPRAAAVFRYRLDQHGFAPSYTLEVETNGAARRRDMRALDMTLTNKVTAEVTFSADDLARLAEAIRRSGFPKIAVPPDYMPDPNSGLRTVSVTVTDGETAHVSIPQFADSPEMQMIAEAFPRL